MPLFFFFSGYCFNDKYFSQPFTFIKKKITGLYFPYVKWSLIFLLFHNIFFTIGIYNEKFEFLGQVQHLYSLQGFRISAQRIIKGMYGHEQLLGGYWFMNALFFGSIIAFSFLYLIHKLRRNATESKAFIFSQCLILSALLLLVLYLMSAFQYTIPFFNFRSQAFLAALFFIIGYTFSRASIRTFTIAKSCLAFIIVIACSFYCKMEAGYDYFDLRVLVPYCFAAITGSWCTFSFPWEKLPLIIRNILSYIGNNTFSILTFHFICFKLITWLIISIFGLSTERLAEFPVCEEYAIRGWWIVYLLIGIILPLGIQYSFDWLQRLIKTNI